jgi:hypothetical protein
VLPLLLLEARVGLFVLQDDDCCTVIQTSVSALTAHCSAEDIIGIARDTDLSWDPPCLMLLHLPVPLPLPVMLSLALRSYKSTQASHDRRTRANCRTHRCLDYVYGRQSSDGHIDSGSMPRASVVEQARRPLGHRFLIISTVPVLSCLQ